MSFPFVKQHDSMQCGVACVAMICRHYGKTISLRYLENHCRPSKEGVSLKGLADLCGFLKLECTAGRAGLEDPKACPLPCILHWDQNHFVVLHKIDRDGARFWIAHPAKGRYRLSTVSNADNIIVVSGGTIAESGSHSELVGLRGAYFNLVRNQLELGN